MKIDNLLPCPFCGGEAKLKTARESDGQISYDSICVACLNCRSTGLSYTTYYNVSSNPEEEAIAAWNRRADARQLALKTRVCPMCEDCPDGCPVETPKDSRNIVANADRIRSMSDKELVWVMRRGERMTDRIADITARCYEGRPYLRNDMEYLLSQLAKQDKEIERLKGAQKQAIKILQQIEWVGGGAKGLIEDAITAICEQSIPGKRVTNGDRMRAMGDEELARFLWLQSGSALDWIGVDIYLDWLKQPAEEEHR